MIIFILGIILGCTLCVGTIILGKLIIFFEEEKEAEAEVEINHPSHYNIPGRKECIVEMEEKFGPLAVYHFCVCNNYKYTYRAGEKETALKEDDLSKAEWYANYADKVYQRIGEEKT